MPIKLIQTETEPNMISSLFYEIYKRTRTFRGQAHKQIANVDFKARKTRKLKVPTSFPYTITEQLT